MGDGKCVSVAVNCDGKFKLGKTMKLSDHAEYTCAMGSGSKLMQNLADWRNHVTISHCLKFHWLTRGIP